MSSLKQFKIIKLLGKGSYSKVYKVRRIQNGDIYALKKVKLGKLTRKEKENSLNEVRILASIKHPYIISYKEAFYDKRESCLCIVMEYAGSGDMLNKIRQFKKKKYFPEKLIWKYLIQLIKALKKLHDMKILHRDLKCANVFISKDEKRVKLGDLNVSKVAKKGLVKTQTGKITAFWFI